MSRRGKQDIEGLDSHIVSRGRGADHGTEGNDVPVARTIQRGVLGGEHRQKRTVLVTRLLIPWVGTGSIVAVSMLKMITVVKDMPVGTNLVRMGREVNRRARLSKNEQRQQQPRDHASF